MTDFAVSADRIRHVAQSDFIWRGSGRAVHNSNETVQLENDYTRLKVGKGIVMPSFNLIA
jgi:hypothetical protein